MEEPSWQRLLRYDRRTLTPIAADAMDDFAFCDNRDASRYELRRGGALMAWIDYRLQDGIVVLTHTEVDAASEGQGLGSKVAGRALDEVRRRGLKVRPACDFVARFIGRNPAYADLLDARPA